MQLAAYRELRELLAVVRELNDHLAKYRPAGLQHGVLLASHEDHRDWTVLQEIYWHHRPGGATSTLIEVQLGPDNLDDLADALALADTLIDAYIAVYEHLMYWPDRLGEPTLEQRQ